MSLVNTLGVPFLDLDTPEVTSYNIIGYSSISVLSAFVIILVLNSDFISKKKNILKLKIIQ